VGAQVLSELRALPGRMRALEGVGGCQLIDETRDTTVESSLQVLDWMGEVRSTNGRVIFIMGDLAATDTPQMRALEQRIVETADVLITQGRRPAQVGRAVVARGMPRDQVHVTFSHADAITCARKRLKPNDLLVVVGSAQACMERVLQGLLLRPADAEHLVTRSEAAAPSLSTTTARSCRSWVEIDLAAIAGNVRLFKQMLGPDIALLAAVRADAYGHGAVEVGATAALNGADYLGVVSVDEGVKLRESGLGAPILVMGYTPAGLARSVIDHDLTISLFDAGTAQAFQDVARAFNTRVRVHYHVDTGLGRLGVPVSEIPTFFRAVANLNHLQAEGLYTQLAGIDRTQPARIRQQLATFRQVIDTLAASGIRFVYCHAADTTAAIALPESRFSMVRAGSGIYGLNPSPVRQMHLPEGFRPAMSWKTRVVQVKTLPAGAVVGHSDDYTTRGEETIAAISAGCADGLHSDWPCALVRGQRVPLAGPIGMDHATLNVTDVPGVSIGDEVVLLGRQDEQVITVDMVAKALGVVNHAIVTGILARRPDCRVIKG
jgi:alanine racemase